MIPGRQVVIWKPDQIFKKSDREGDVSQGTSPSRFCAVFWRPEGNWRLSPALQLPILIFVEFQPYSAAAVFDGVVERLAPFKVEPVASVLRHLDELRRVLKGKFAGQGSLQIFLKELAVPALPVHEEHIDAPAR
jgi:hypothetical protein